jgi:hypothetical protein
VSGLPRHPREWALLVHVAVLLAAIRRLLPLMALPAVLERLTPRRSSADPTSLDMGVVYADALLARMPIGKRGDCLPRSLVIYHLGRRAGMPVQLHCGVRRSGAGLEGHAWCTCGGVVLAGGRADGFVETYRFPPAPR